MGFSPQRKAASMSMIREQEPSMVENGVLFDINNEETYPPEYTFVVINVLPNVPVYFDREQNTWWTATISKGDKDMCGFNDLYDCEDDMEIYWQPIAFKKADALLIPGDK